MDVNDQLIDLYDRATMGRQVEEFLSSDVGRYIMTRLRDRKKDEMERLLTVDASKPTEVLKLQLSVQINQEFASWLLHAINDGVNATQQIQGDEDEQELG